VTPFRVLVVGAGEAATLLHLPVLARLRDAGRLVLVEICDLRSDRAGAAQRRFGFDRASGDAASAIGRSDIDAVYLFATAQLHHRYGLQALRSGKHLFVEKPVAPSHAEACELAAAAHDNRRIAVGGHNRRFYRSLAEIRAQASRAGWQSAEAVFHKPAHGTPVPFGARTWLGANGIHTLDALIFLMGGPPDHLMSVAEGAAGSPDRFSSLMRWQDGRTATFLCNNQAGARREDYVVHAPGKTCRATEEGLSIEEAGRSIRLDRPAIGDGFEAEHAAFLDAIATGTEPIHSLAALAPSLRIAEFIEEGFTGAVQLPPKAPSAPPPAQAQARSHRAGSLLVVNPGRFKDALAAGPVDRPLLALDDLRRSAGPRPDIVGALIAAGPERLAPDVLDAMPNLSVVGLAGLSFARHDPDALLDRGIALLHASTAHAESVAQFALGLAILGRRCAFPAHEALRRGGWGASPRATGVLRVARALRPIAERVGFDGPLLRLWRRAAPRVGADGPLNLPHDLRGATVGLIGWSANARLFAGHLIALGARVRAWSEHASPEALRAMNVAPVSLGDALGADIVSLHRGLTPATRHFLGARELARLRPGAILINVARGALIDPDALLERLREGDIFACLDTFEEEPLPASHPLRALPNVFLTPHIAGGSPDMHAAAAEEIVGKLLAYLEGEPVDTLSAARLATMT